MNVKMFHLIDYRYQQKINKIQKIYQAHPCVSVQTDCFLFSGVNFLCYSSNISFVSVCYNCLLHFLSLFVLYFSKPQHTQTRSIPFILNHARRN